MHIQEPNPLQARLRAACQVTFSYKASDPDAQGKVARHPVDMRTYQIRPLRWLGSIMLGLAGIYILSAVVVRIMRRIRPGLTPLYAAPSLNMPARGRLFGTPAQVLDRAGIRPGMRVLEVGPGPGFFTIPLAQRVSTGEGGSVTCVEFQPEMIAMLRERQRTSELQNMEVLRGDGRHMALAENSFDVVFLADMIGETLDLPALFREYARVLKPGGVLAVTEQIMDPDFRLPKTVRTLAVSANLLDTGSIGVPFWAYMARFCKPAIYHLYYYLPSLFSSRATDGTLERTLISAH